jgi:outer membrane receptor for ferrienterochelin and colicins
MRFQSLIQIASLIFLPLGLACAQNDPYSAGIQEIAEDKQLFQEIPSVFTASKYEQKVSEAPGSISIVTADEIKKWGYRNMGDILSSLRGFYTTSDRQYGSVGARGFGLPTDYNTRLLLLIDGNRYNDNIFESFYINEDFPVDIDMIERVEVVRGPSSSLYGSNAFFGVINVITKRGRDLDGANIKGSYGSNDTYKTSASYGKRFSNGVEAFLTGTVYDSQGNNHFYTKEFDQLIPGHDPRAANNGFYENNDEESSKRFLGKLSYGDFTLEGVLSRRKKGIPTASFGTIFNDPRTNSLDQAAFVYLNYNHTFENQINLQSRISYNSYRYSGDYPNVSTADGNLDKFALNEDLARGQWWRATTELSKVLFNDHKVTVGSEYQDNFDQFLTNFNVRGGSEFDRLSSKKNSNRWAFYVQDQYSITDKLIFNAGVRYDFYSIFGGTVNPRLGLIYSPRDKTSIKLLYGTAFRAPNQYELHSPFKGVLSNDKLRPEKLETTELVLENYFNDHLRGEFNVFHTVVNDIITFVDVHNGNTQYQNRDNVDSNGVELQLEDNWGNGFQGRISYSWQDTRFKANNSRLPNSPEHMVKLNLITPLWQDKVFFGFETQYLSNRGVDATSEHPASKVNDYVVSNLTVFTKNWIRGLELSAGAYNLFDERYFDPGSSDHRQIGIQRDGITFRAKASMDF